MHRVILQACLPCFIALIAAFALAVAVVKISGANLNWRRLRQLHACQDGGVQSLSFVLTLPLFIFIVMFILQVSQLMIGTIVVHYSAFAAARAASVWIPAEVGTELENRVNLPPEASDASQRLLLVPVADQQSAARNSYKYSRIRMAAILGCAPIAPSRDLPGDRSSLPAATLNAIDATQRMYQRLVPGSFERTPRIPKRLENKIAYADRNTLVFVEWRDANNGNAPNTLEGPTYNPVAHPCAGNPPIPGCPQNPRPLDMFEYKPNEVGWQDATTVFVVHRFALLPGPGKLLSEHLVRRVGMPSRLQQFLPADWLNSARGGDGSYVVLMPASATISNEGLRSVVPYQQDRR